RAHRLKGVVLLHRVPKMLRSAYRLLSRSTSARQRSGIAVHHASSYRYALPILSRLFRFSWKWRRRSPSKVKERTHEEATEALRPGREGRHPEAASVGEGTDLEAL